MTRADLMMKAPFRRLAAALALVAFAAPVRAASTTTEVFVAAVVPKIAFLRASAELAETHAGHARWRGFARTEIRDQALAEGDLDRWRGVERSRDARDAAASTLDGLGPVANVVTTPFAVIADAASRVSPPLTPLPSADRAEAANQVELRRLAALHGAAFDAAYSADQADTLGPLARLYKDFIVNGDDPTLRKMAVRNLPRVARLLAMVRR